MEGILLAQQTSPSDRELGSAPQALLPTSLVSLCAREAASACCHETKSGTERV